MGDLPQRLNIIHKQYRNSTVREGFNKIVVLQETLAAILKS